MANTTINYSEPATIATAIRTYVKTNHPECKFSVTRRNFNVITVALMEAPFEVYTEEAKLQASNDGDTLGGDDYCRSGFFSKKFTKEAHDVLSDVEDFMHSLNYDNSDPYTDYFDRGFYDYLKVGTWNKPLKVTEHKAEPAPAQEEATPAKEEPTVETVPAALPEMPAAAPADAVYTVHVYMYAGELKKDMFVTEFFNISLADFVKYIEDNADTIENSIGAAPVFDYFVYKNCKSLVNGYACNFKGDMLQKIAAECPDEYASISTAISDPDKDPDPTKPTRKPDYTAFDTSFKKTKVIAVSFDGATCSASDGDTVPAVSPIDETAAKQGHDSYSTSDYKAGSATAAYNAAVASVKAAADEVREHIPEEYRGELDKLVNRYASKLADWTNRKNRTDASCPSWFITGAANYPHRKHDNHCVFRSHISVC